ncbi:uncharacterized protein LOC143861482 [Tasmannia lanceolata]|uniref:uncharacterized protein LOC143861482 n=1 Tax=Tasmannia lanceolata TaxID=3420 RepID=UPI0040631E72
MDIHNPCQEGSSKDAHHVYVQDDLDEREHNNHMVHDEHELNDMVHDEHELRHSFDIKFLYNGKVRVSARCKTDGCQWRIHASLTEDTNTFMIKTFERERSNHCRSVNNEGNQMSTASWVCDKIKERIRKEPEWAVQSIKNHLYVTYHLKLQYHKVWHAKQKALEIVFGSFEDSFSHVPQFCNALLTYNPGSIVKYSTGSDHSFEHMFLALDACNRGFIGSCRPLLGLDGCFLKGKYKGVLLAPVALDANDGLYPLAFATVVAEDEPNWRWFLEQLKQVRGMPIDLTFISDRQKGLINAVANVFPLANHRFCVRHMYKNFKKVFPGLALQKLFF